MPHRDDSNLPGNIVSGLEVNVDWRDDRIGSALRRENPTVIAEMSNGFAVIGDTQFLPGYCVLVAKDPTLKALGEMPRSARIEFLANVDLLATAVQRVCTEMIDGFTRTNIDILGNTDEFVHAHVWPRFSWEPDDRRIKPVWLYSPEHWTDSAYMLGETHASIKNALRAELLKLQENYPRFVPQIPELLSATDG